MLLEYVNATDMSGGRVDKTRNYSIDRCRGAMGSIQEPLFLQGAAVHSRLQGFIRYDKTPINLLAKNNQVS